MSDNKKRGIMKKSIQILFILIILISSVFAQKWVDIELD